MNFMNQIPYIFMKIPIFFLSAPFMRGQYGFKYWFGAIMQSGFAWNDTYLDVWSQVTWLGNNELNLKVLIQFIW